MRFKLDEIDDAIKIANFEILYMFLDTWLKCDKQFVSSDNKCIYYRKIRVIYFENADLLAMRKEDREFFGNDGVEGQ